MQGRTYLDLAREVVTGGDELHWRGATIHAYYALVLECRDTLRRWGVIIPRTQIVHTSVRLRLLYATNADLNRIARELDWMGKRRNNASYDMSLMSHFTSDRVAQNAITSASDMLALLDAIDGAPPAARPPSPLCRLETAPHATSVQLADLQQLPRMVRPQSRPVPHLSAAAPDPGC
jgi:hypothetical protein